jgi:hypothetical protein
MSGVFKGKANNACKISPNIPTGISDFTSSPTFCAPVNLRRSRRSHIPSGLHCCINSTVVVGIRSFCYRRIKYFTVKIVLKLMNKRSLISFLKEI